MLSETPEDETVANGIKVGVALALKAEDSGEWKPVVDWLARNPEHAVTFADFLAAQRGLIDLIPPRPRASVRVGAMLAQFELKEEIGCGGMGVVYRAVDNLKREVAVKLLRSEAYSTMESARFRFEAEMVASLDHPNIVKILTFGEFDGSPFLVMPLMNGGSLSTWLKSLGPDRSVDPKKAASLVRDIALGVHHAHQRGLIHRDLKPGNILLDHEGTPHVADFGLARPLDMTASVSGRIVGTIPYMAPEQARGEKGLTTAVDIHALGAILYELLTGRTPFVGGDMASVIRRVIEEPAPSVRTLRPDADIDLEAICKKCLNKEPGDRYSSAEALAEDLTRFLDGEPVSVQQTGWIRETLRRALGKQRVMEGVVSWRVAFWGSASTGFAMAMMQTAVLLDAPLWVLQATIAYYLLAYMSIIWYYLVLHRDALNPIERASTALHYGIKFGCLASLIVGLWLHDGNPVYVLPMFLVVIGLGVYAHGIMYWGRYYLVGASFFVVAAFMPLVPVKYWPSVYGLYLCVFQILSGLHLRGVQKVAETQSKQSSTTPTE